MELRILPVFVIYISQLFNLISSDDPPCTWGNYDFSPLAGQPWMVYNLTNEDTVLYTLNLCGSLPETDCSGSPSVCRQTGSQYDSTGYFAAPLNFTEENKQLQLQLSGAACPLESGLNYTTIIHFKCGKTLGSPVLLDSYACDTYFEWQTSLACAGATATNEVRCHVYGSDHKKYDLSPLIQSKSGHHVESTEDAVYINVCRGITQNGETSACPAGAAACLITADGAVDIGQPTGPLTRTQDGQLYLHYVSDNPPSRCTSSAATDVTFICPANRGESHPPRLISSGSEDCQYHIEWITEYACPEDSQISHHCWMTLAEHNVQVNLTALTYPPESDDQRYVAHGQNQAGTKEYQYVMNICGDAGVGCPQDKNGIASCQLDGEDPAFGHSLGRTATQTLRYSDRSLTLTYSGGDTCHDNFERTTVIHFHCNKSAEFDGRGQPVYNNEEEHCVYLFDWDTKYACIEEDLACSVQQGGAEYDLSSLKRTTEGSEQNWVRGTEDGDYFLNVCGELLGGAGSPDCPSGAAACFRGSDGAVRSLGQFTQGPTVVSPGQLQLHYTDGDACGDQKYETIITLRCLSEHGSSVPQFVEQHGCVYEFEWETAAACILSTQAGTNCRVNDEQAGYSFDLSVLTKTGTDPFYHVTNDEYDYYLNVCGDIGDAQCAGTDNVGGCQVKTAQSSENHVLGQANSELVYYNGLISLMYTQGDEYSDSVKRQMKIAFLCNRTVEQGAPEFHVETDHTYTFLWETRYACPDSPMECSVIDETNHVQYDLSGLLRETSQGMWIISDGQGHNFYINICGAVEGIPQCAHGAAVCATTLENAQEVQWMSNLGEVGSAPSLEDNGQILIEYVSSVTCGDGHYTSRIHVQCVHDQETHLTYLAQDDSDDCIFSFLLSSSEACPPQEAESSSDEPCTVVEPNTGHIFNLKPLTKKPTEAYQVTHEQNTFKINVCGAVTGCDPIEGVDPAVCQGANTLAKVNSKLDLSDQTQLTITYTGTLTQGHWKRVKIEFVCNQSVPLGSPEYQRLDGTTHHFVFGTSLACLPSMVDCHVLDQHGQTYDLTPLYKAEGNWEVPQGDSSGTMYHINVCGPMNPVSVAGQSCPGSNIGGCQIAANGPHNLGYIQSHPVVADNGTLTVRYLGGEMCHKGTEHESLRSTRILFFCSLEERLPVFVAETPECEYVFHWFTPAACPRKVAYAAGTGHTAMSWNYGYSSEVGPETSVWFVTEDGGGFCYSVALVVMQVMGSGCQVTDTAYGHTFDLTSLHAATDYSVPSGEYSYLLNICGALNAGPDGCDGENVAACQTKPADPNFHYDIGHSNQTLIYENGVLHLDYYEGKEGCHGKYTRSTHITFLCDHKASGTEGLHHINESDDCGYEFEWTTPLACLPRQQGTCSAASDGHQYDLSALTLTDRNYQVQDPSGNRLFVLNVCSTVINQQYVTCPPGSTVCIFNPLSTGSDRFQQIGGHSDEPLQVLPSGDLVLTYPTTITCPSDPSKTYSTTINLSCPENGETGQPHFVFEEGCSFTFRWDTHVACPQNEDTAIATGACQVTDTTTGRVFDLSGLKSDHGYHVSDRNGHEIWFSICSELPEDTCDKQGVGACKQDSKGDSKINTGNFNSNLIYDQGLIYLNYSGGDACNSQTARNTLIYFIPGVPGAGNGEPVFITDDNDCTYHISFYTELVATGQEQWSCSATDDHGNVFDLSPLTRSQSYHLALLLSPNSDNSDTTYYINVCGALAPIEGVLCPPMSAACSAEPGLPPKSLGRMGGPPTYDSMTKEVTLKYDHGSPCPTNPNTNISTKIIFTCETGPDQGEPYFLDFSDCQYVFNWGTNLMCPNTDVVSADNTECTFLDTQRDYTYNLAPLTKAASENSGYQVPAPGGGTYYINVCGSVVDTVAKTAGCTDTPVCLVKEGQGLSFGSTSKHSYILEGKDLKVTWTNENSRGSCAHAASHIVFKCDWNVQGTGSPTYFLDSDCNAVFEWSTSYACPPVVTECAIAHDSGTIDLRTLSRPTDSWIITDDSKNKYWLNLCQSVHGTASEVSSDICRSNAAVCRKLADGTADMLGTVQTQKIYMDGDTIVIEYSGGTNACDVGRRRSASGATTKVRLTCGTTLGEPVLKPRTTNDDHCEFVFDWNTTIACKEERESVELKDGRIQDPKTGYSIDYAGLVGDSVTKEVAHSQHEYVISLGSHDMNINGCEHAAVCKKEATASITVGEASQAKYYIEGDVLEVVWMSNTACTTESGKQHKSILDIKCDAEAAENSDPTYVYTSNSCEHFINWYTPKTCIENQVHSSVLPVKPSSGSHSNTAGIVIGILSVIVLLAILIVVFRKPERRIAVKQRLRSVFSRTSWGRSVSYTQLRSSDENSLLGGDTRVIPAFHDDSDEDLIL